MTPSHIQKFVPADRAAWLAARQRDVTASVAAAVLNAHPYTTQFKLWAAKMGHEVEPDEATDAMKRGVYLEPVGVAMLRDEYPEWDIEYHADNAYYRDPDLRIGATPDAFAFAPGREGRGNVQIKSASDEAFRMYWLDPDTKEVIPPTWIALQAITEAKLTGCSWACVAVVVITWRGTLKLHVVDVPLHDRLWARLKQGVAEFWALADSGEHPPIDWSKDGAAVLNVYQDVVLDRKDFSDDPELDVLVTRYVGARGAKAEASKLLDVLKPQIIYALGNSAGGMTASFEFTANVQHREEHVTKASSGRVLRVKPRKVAHSHDRF